MSGRPSSTTLVIVTTALLVGAAVGAGAGGLLDDGDAAGDTGPNEPSDDRFTDDRFTGDWPTDGDGPDLETFASEEEFATYFERGRQSGAVNFGGAVRTGGDDAGGVQEEGDAGDGGDGAAAGDPAASGGDGASRHSGTNVQEATLDEPDTLKTDGESAYYAGHRFRSNVHETTVLDVSDPAEPAAVATIPASGDLLLVEERDALVVLGDDRAYGFDVSDPADPQQLWTERVEGEIETARLYDGDVYLVLVDRPRSGDPCPIEPYGDDAVACTDVYRPGDQADADAVYTATRVDPETGDAESSASVVGSARNSATYVSESAIYLSYTRSTSNYDLYTGYLTGPGAEHLDDRAIERLETLQALNISSQAKAVELRQILADWRNRLPDDERDEASRELEEGLSAFAADHQRELTTTGIARISIEDDLAVTASGEVPGHPLNQWSMDEHDDHLRIATTIPGTHGVDSENDVYVLDSDLERTGAVQGLGVTERIYSVRFQGDEGYVVTFREIDPFYTLDLADPTNPTVEGELKLPGFSTYLHPLDEEGDLVLGIGEEEGEVKATTFDVTDRTDPVVRDSVILDEERFSAVNRNHRAFLQDPRHEVFFLPGGESSYVFSYENGTLEEQARVDVGGPGVRAMYLDDYLYVLGQEDVVVLDETTWEEETRVDARGD